ncbi:MAG: hypothetical protein JEZ03_13665 [Bacteroidales bacterium]|nr:hypothetical protein [Bacteroidales bacterium]
MKTTQKQETEYENSNNHLKPYLLEECYAMVKYLSAEGKQIPLNVEELLDQKELDSKKTIVLHRNLATLVAPARPKTICLLYYESKKKGILSFLGPVGLIRRLMLTTFLSLGAFILLSLSPEINNESIIKGTLEDSGLELLLNLLYLLSAAALGGCFSNLFQAHKYILNGTYDPKYECSYWIRFVMGLVAGLMLAVIIPVTANLESATEQSVGMITIPLLAMLGGFSASLVYRILNRLVFAVESLITGSESDQNERKIVDLQKSHEREKSLNHQAYIMNLQGIQTLVNQNQKTEVVNKKISEMIGSNSENISIESFESTN